jgi:hypothetical protein
MCLSFTKVKDTHIVCACDLLNDFVNKEINSFKRLANMLEEILFEIDM